MMEIFYAVNELAVVGVAIFMMAVGTLWYSPYLFQKTWLAEVKYTEADLTKIQSHTVIYASITFVMYVIGVFILASLIGYASRIDVSVQTVAILSAFAYAALAVGFTIWEGRSYKYYVITLGFSTVFIIGSSFLLSYWPW